MSLWNKRFFKTFCCTVIIFSLSVIPPSFAQTVPDTVFADQCIGFEAPLPLSVVKTKSCTLSIKSCPSIRLVNFKVEYKVENEERRLTALVGKVNAPPFTAFWDISSIPNQTLEGAICIAELELENKKTAVIRQEGVFFLHQPIIRPIYEVVATEAKANEKTTRMTLQGANTNSTGFVVITKNKQRIMFHIEVKNQYLFTPFPFGDAEKFGVTIALDPDTFRYPYLTKDIILYTIPLSGKPYQTIAGSQYSGNGRFEVLKKIVPCSFPSSVKADNFKGYVVDFEIPLSALNHSGQGNIGCNIIANVLDEKTLVQDIAWNEGNKDQVLTPAYYGTISFVSGKSQSSFNLIRFLISIGIGILIGTVLVLLFHAISRILKVRSQKFSDSEKELLQSIILGVEEEIGNKDLKAETLSQQIGCKSRTISRLIKRRTGMTFGQYLRHARVQIAKEQLRSSNASETSIAHLCGFEAVEEMEQSFIEFCSILPSQFRNEHKVS